MLRRRASVLATLAASVCAQEPAPLAQPDRELLEQRLARLDARGTDWLQLLDTGDKVQALGAAAVPVVAAAAAAARERPDQRFALRLLGVLARIDAAGVQQLRELAAGGPDGTAAIAARVIGRCGAPADAVGDTLLALLRDEQRPVVASAIAMAAADANATKVAPEIRKWLEERRLEPAVAKWFAIALAVTTDADAKTLRQWLTAGGPLADTAMLAARRHRDPELTKLLLERLPDVDDETTSSWLVQSLGATGGEGVHSALFAALAARRAAADPGVHVVSSEVDPLRLALMRLRDSGSMTWARKLIETNNTSLSPSSVTMQTLSPQIACVPALLGKWRTPNAAALLAKAVQDDKVETWLRVHAARGLCWQHDARGLVATADILAAPLPARFVFGIDDAQATLHQFVANADRPDYMRIEPGDRETPGAVGKQWQQWLRANEGKVKWRELTWIDDDMVLWR